MDQQAITETKNKLIKYLRLFLQNSENYIELSHGKKYDNFEIYDKQPRELIHFPSILITAINGDYINSGIGDISQEIYNDEGDFIGYRYSGMFELPVTIEIATKTTPDRDILTDIISMALRVLLRRHLESEGILIKNMRYGGEGEIQYDSDKIYISTLQFTTWSEWYRDVYPVPLVGIDVSLNKNNNKD